MSIRKDGLVTVLLAVLAFGGGIAAAGSLETRFTVVVVKDLPIGRSTRVQLRDGEKYGVENKSDKAVSVGFSASRPQESVESWPAIPAIAWVTISPVRVKIPAGGKAQTDVTISVPDDPAFAGKEYEFWLRASTDEQIGVTLVTRVRFNTVARR